ncbi:metallophosphoesterase [Pedobacter frigidisoli]|uniref:metallophosphoesterase family protein n=1 Tax=Pedobacter frigidisoli TaxID=2530455 RepID=UPI002930C0CD|nr:metallophosphoesterase [Pedobacter frigidisoli]
MRILHITDFHIDSPDNDNENLRTGYYKEFIDNLFYKITEHNLNDIDLIINSGDFVNMGKVENFPHASAVMKYVVEKANLSKTDVAVCLGNHDFKMKVPGTIEEKFSPFDDFAKDFVPGALLKECKRAKLFLSNKKNVQVLIVDNALTELDKNQPINLSLAEMDAIISMTREFAVQSKDLVVVTHYPVINFPMAKYSAEVEGWAKDHVWRDGYNLQHRLGNLRPHGETIFICGDGHIPDAFKTENRAFIMTGVFGGDYTKRHSIKGGASKSFYIETQARIIDFSEDKPLQVSTFNYKPIAYDYDPGAGNWLYEQSELREISVKVKASPQNVVSKTNILGEPLQKAILDRVRIEKLYKIGRFVTSPETSSFSWVSINRIFENQQIFNTLIDKSVEQINLMIKDSSKTMMLGVDFYGAMIGTHISLRVGSEICCLSSRSVSDENDDLMHILLQRLAQDSYKDIIIVTDVISSGSSVLKIIDEIDTLYKKQTNNELDVKYHSISVIADVKIQRSDFDARVSSILTACRDLRMPIFKTDQLPDVETLPARFNATGNID